MKKIDIEHWNRRITYQNFIGYTNPACSVTSRLDVTELVSFCKQYDKSFFACFLYLVTRCVNEVEELRLRLSDGDVVLYDWTTPSYILLREDEALTTCASEVGKDFPEFYQTVEQDIQSAMSSAENNFNKTFVLSRFYVSCLPWVDLVSVNNPYHLDDQAATSIPRITWGKYVKNEADRLEMGMDISVHHALADGLHIAKVFRNLSEILKNPAEFILGGKYEG